MPEPINYRIPTTDMMRENLFWLRIMRDHSQFLLATLAPGETALINQAQQFYQIFDQLLKRASAEQDARFNQEVAQAVLQLRSFKLHLVNLELAGQVPVNLPPGALNEMLDEADEYLRILNMLPKTQPLNEAGYLLHQHLLWLPNNAAHTALVCAQLDPAEANLAAFYRRYHELFRNLCDKALELKMLMRDNPYMVPSLIYLTRESAGITREFKKSAEEYRELRATAQVLAISPPLLADHFAREASYYLEKIRM